MDINTLIDSLAEGIANDATLKNWANVSYAQDVTVFLNFDERNPPTSDQCPAVCVFPADKSYSGGRYLDTIEYVCILHDAEAREHVSIADIVEYVGVRHIETFRRHVLAVIAAIIEDTDTSRISDVSVAFDTITQFPYILAETVLTIETPWTIGQGNPITIE
jgi:hypothetical protein